MNECYWVPCILTLLSSASLWPRHRGRCGRLHGAGAVEDEGGRKRQEMVIVGNKEMLGFESMRRLGATRTASSCCVGLRQELTAFVCF